MFSDFAAVLVFVLAGAAFVFGNLLLGRLVRPRRPSASKATVYECGEPTIGSPWVRYNSRFYNVALVYLLFDVEVVVLLPAAVVLRELGQAGRGLVPLVAILVFLGLLALGLAYEWFYGNLDWIRAEEPEPPGEAEEMPQPAQADQAERAVV